MLTLAVIGTAAGVFSGLFGVGGGIVMVPLLVLWLGYGEREATGTSLAAIVVIAAAATLTHGAYGNVHVEEGVLVGVPAVGGVLAGTWLQQRVPPRTVSLLLRGAARRRRPCELRARVIEAVAHRGLRRASSPGCSASAAACSSSRRSCSSSTSRTSTPRRRRCWRSSPSRSSAPGASTRYGNVRLRDGLLVGALAIPAAAVGVVVVNAVPERALEVGFAVLLLFVAAQLVRGAGASPDRAPARP